MKGNTHMDHRIYCGILFYPVSVLQRSIKFERPVTRLLSALWEKDMIKYLLENKKFIKKKIPIIEFK